MNIEESIKEMKSLSPSEEAIETLLTAYEKEKEERERIGKLYYEANENCIKYEKMIKKEKEKNKELEDTLKQTQNSWYEDTKIIKKKSKEIEEAEQKEKKAYIDGTNVAHELCNKKWKDEIKAKIEELEKDLKEYENGQEWEIQDEIRGQIDILQSLLEKE